MLKNETTKSPRGDAAGVGKSSPAVQSQTTDLDDKQIDVVRRVLRFLEQFNDRQQMRADAYLAKYMNMPTCEASVTDLKWDLEGRFPDVR